GMSLSRSAVEAARQADLPYNAVVYDRLYWSHWDEIETPDLWRHIFSMPVTFSNGSWTADANDAVDLMFAYESNCPMKPFGDR
ncbi:hypothetical protein KIPB_015698, partial [Kipferlia bialata]